MLHRKATGIIISRWGGPWFRDLPISWRFEPLARNPFCFWELNQVCYFTVFTIFWSCTSLSQLKLQASSSTPVLLYQVILIRSVGVDVRSCQVKLKGKPWIMSTRSTMKQGQPEIWDFSSHEKKLATKSHTSMGLMAFSLPNGIPEILGASQLVNMFPGYVQRLGINFW